MKRKLLLAVPISEKGDYTHYLLYEMKKGIPTLISCDTPEQAKDLNFDYNKVNSGLPPYTHKVHYSDHDGRLKGAVRATLSLMKKKGKYEIQKLSGWITSENITFEVE